VSEQQNRQEFAELEQVNAELTRSLKRCHTMVDDYRSKFANSNNPEAANEDGEQEHREG
jgi:hypothetical protein